MKPSSTPERFELSLAGGASEALYRRLRPDVERLPWEHAWKVDASPEQVTEARVQWTLAALQEYRSAALQSEVLRAMVRARVPLDLSAVASSFSLDELAHAEVCARVAHALGGGAPVSYDPDQVFSLRAPERDAPALDPLLTATAQVAGLYCVGEAWSHAFLASLRRAARIPQLRAVWGLLTRDEAVHARFGWMFLEWARGALDEAAWRVVESSARAQVAALRANWRGVWAVPAAAFSAISPLGDGGAGAYQQRAERALRHHVLTAFARLGIDANPPA